MYLIYYLEISSYGNKVMPQLTEHRKYTVTGNVEM